jgi:hypothetical protein
MAMTMIEATILLSNMTICPTGMKLSALLAKDRLDKCFAAAIMLLASLWRSRLSGTGRGSIIKQWWKSRFWIIFSNGLGFFLVYHKISS